MASYAFGFAACRFGLENPPMQMRLGPPRSSALRSYLANQCVPAFQLTYLERHPDLLEGLAEPGLMLEADSDNNLVASLYASGVLPESIRVTFVEHLIDYCLSGTDGAVLWARPLRKMLTAAEEATFRRRLLTEVVPHPRSILRGFVDGVHSDSDPEDFTAPVGEFADALEAEFPNDASVETAAQDLRNARSEWIEEHGREERPQVDGARYRAPELAERNVIAERSIFDDLVPDPT